MAMNGGNFTVAEYADMLLVFGEWNRNAREVRLVSASRWPLGLRCACRQCRLLSARSVGVGAGAWRWAVLAEGVGRATLPAAHCLRTGPVCRRASLPLLWRGAGGPPCIGREIFGKLSLLSEDPV